MHEGLSRPPVVLAFTRWYLPGYQAGGPNNLALHGLWPLRQGREVFHGPEGCNGRTGTYVHLPQRAQQGKKF